MDIYMANSTNGGTTFGITKRVNEDSILDQRTPDIAVDNSNQNLYVVWVDQEPSGHRITSARSTDFGATFGPNVPVNDTSGLTITRSTPAIAVYSNNQNIFVVWSQETPTGNVIMFDSSTDFGSSFGPDKRVSDSTDPLVSEFYPDLAVNGTGHVVVVWEGEDSILDKDIRSSYSSDFGDAFGDGFGDNDIIVNNVPTGDQETPAITADGIYFFVVWLDGKISDPEINFSKSGDGGLSWGTNYPVGAMFPSRILGFPCIATYGDQAYVAWWDNRSDPKFDIYFTNGTILDAAPWIIDMSVFPDTVPAGWGKINLTLNASDDVDLENALTVIFEYRDPNSQNWNTSFFEPKTYVGTPPSGYWHIYFTTPLDAPVGFYDFRVRIQDQSGKWSNWLYDHDAVFISIPPDVTPPEITSGPDITARTDTTATIEWTTDEESICRIWYGLGIIDTETVPTPLSTSHSITLTNLKPGRLYRFRVNASDIENNNMTSSVFSFTTKFPIYLNPGWNMISVPLNQTDDDLREVFKSITDDYDAVQWYDVSDPADQWKHNHKVKPPALNDLDIVNRLKGVWIHVTNPLGTTFYIDGIAPDAGYINDITLYKGWNFVGYPSLIERSPISSGLPAEVDSVGWFNATSAQWELWDPGTYHDPDNLNLLVPGQGLWIHYTGITDVWSLEYAN
jgi:hypothetical protein